jgi:hypothetical protein
VPVSTGPELTELAIEERLEETATTELEDLLDETTATELDDLLDGASDETTLEELVPPQAAAVNCALFLPTPAYWSSLSFTHCGVTGE